MGSAFDFCKFVMATILAALLLTGLARAESAPEAEAPPPATAEAGALPQVLDARVTTTPERARLVLDLSGQTVFAIASLSDPSRIAIDVRASGLAVEELAELAGEGLVADYSLVQAEEGRARALLTLASLAQVQQAYILDPFADQPARLVVDLIPATEEEFAANVAQTLAQAQGQGVVADEPTQPGGSNIPTVNRPLVVIDPGHGGIDGGAEAPGGIREKDIVLAFSLRLEELLLESGRFDVALTRSSDVFLRLEERVALARQNRADLFISVHADSFQQSTIRGASIYTRDENATDVLDRVLAQNENRADIIAGFAVPAMTPAVVDILVDLMRREMRLNSFLAAEAIVNALEPSVELRNFPVRQADFFVLQAPDVPSVLLELGFLSNPTDAANLSESGWRDRTAEAVARGIASYFDAVRGADEP